MEERLVFIYDTLQAEYLLRRCVGDMFKVGKGNRGDVCISFFDTEKVRQAMTDWKNKK